MDRGIDCLNRKGSRGIYSERSVEAADRGGLSTLSKTHTGIRIYST